MRALKQSLNRLKAGVPRSTWLNTRTFSKHNINEEDPARYCPGGYHPVRIGDEFNSGTYKVISKLGYGIYSTVWLARNLRYISLSPCFWAAVLMLARTNQHFALKFLTADSFDGRKDSFELEILKHVTIQAGESPKVAGSQHVLGLLDEFRHNGPNGQHVCLVFKAMGPDLSKYRRMFPRLAIPIPIAKRISKQLLIALAFLHDDCRVIHTGEFCFLGTLLRGLLIACFSRHQAAEHPTWNERNQWNVCTRTFRCVHTTISVSRTAGRLLHAVWTDFVCRRGPNNIKWYLLQAIGLWNLWVCEYRQLILWKTD